MDTTQATLVLVSLFILRCIVPPVLTLLIGYLMNRLVDRWRAEDEARQAAARAVELPVASLEPRDDPARRTRSSDGLTSRIGGLLPVQSLPCWLVGNCDPQQRASCPAYRNPGVPCWLARLQVEGVLPSGCPDCPIYRQTMA